MSAATILNERHPVHTLVQQHLHRTSTTLHPNIERGHVRFALACAGVGLDHMAAEQAMVFCDESVRGKFGEYFLFTDRRVLGCFGETRYDVRYSQIRELKVETGILTRGVFVTHQDGTKTALTFGSLLQPAGAFFTDVVKLAPDQREPPSRPPCAPSEADPTGAERALARLGVPDDRTALMLRFVRAAFGAGGMPLEIARDFVTRIVLHHRNVHFGRGMTQGRWISAVSMNDLSNLMVQLFGNPLSVSEQPVRTLELASSLKSNAVAKAAVSSAIGLASMAVLGVGWVSTARSPIARFRIMVADTGPFASFRLQGPRGRGLEHESPELAHKIDVRLLEPRGRGADAAAGPRLEREDTRADGRARRPVSAGGSSRSSRRGRERAQRCTRSCPRPKECRWRRRASCRRSRSRRSRRAGPRASGSTPRRA